VIDDPRQVLFRLIRDYGEGLINDPRRFEALLRDLCPQWDWKPRVLLDALKERVPQELTSSSSPTLALVKSEHLARRLETDLALTQEAARWAVDSWALAMGVVTSPPPPQPSPAPPPPPTLPQHSPPAASPSPPHRPPKSRGTWWLWPAGLIALIALTWAIHKFPEPAPPPQVPSASRGPAPTPSVRGLEIENLAVTRTVDGLVIEGEIANRGSTARDVPRLRVALRDVAEKEVQFKIIDPPEARLLPGEAAHFKTPVEHPDATATRVVATFTYSFSSDSGAQPEQRWPPPESRVPPEQRSPPSEHPETAPQKPEFPAAFQEGLADRRVFEQWFSTLSGDYRDGADYWASQRSLTKGETPSRVTKRDGTATWSRLLGPNFRQHSKRGWPTVAHGSSGLAL
jgi:hypothetical protein